MRVPLSWLAEFVEVPVEPRRLADDLTLAGLAVDAVEPHGQDTVLDIDVTTNRVDCMNVYGVAREVSVLYGAPLEPLEASLVESGPPAEQALDVVVEAPDLCPRFCARVLDVRLGPSPAWLRDRLEAAGVRPISNVVDLTNYVMLETGQPSHAFDLGRVPGGRLRVRWGLEGETLRTLDAVERKLGSRVGVVAGAGSEPLALAGIMGGAPSEVSDATRVVALEAAYWEPLAVRRAARALALRTEASHRFERGSDPEAPPLALARLGHLLEKVGAGSVRPGLIDRRPVPRRPRSAVLRPARLGIVLGTEVPEARAHAILEGLGFARLGPEGGGTRFEIPPWRGDVSREADLVEEVARHHGLDRIPSTVPPARAAEGLRAWQRRERLLRETLVGAGLTEVVTYAFVSASAASADPAPRPALANPLSEDQGVLRSSILVPGLLQALKANLRHGRRDVALFEMGRTFAPGAPLPREERRLGILLSGNARPAHWSERARPADVYDVKGIVEALLARLGVGSLETRADDPPPFLHPGRSARLLRGGQPLGHLGALHPELSSSWELKDEPIVAELSLDAVLHERPETRRFAPLPRFPEVARDLSIVCDASRPSADLEAIIRSAGGRPLRSVAVADRYEGPPVPAGQVSLTLTLRFLHPDRTLTGEEVQASLDEVVRALRGDGAEIRGE